MKQDENPLPEKKNARITPVQIVILVIIFLCASLCVVFAISGTLPSFVGIESDSMSPNLNAGDMVFIVEQNRLGSLMTAQEAETAEEMKFGGYGDIIVYNPNGNVRATPMMHRIVSWVNETEAVNNYGFSPASANAGYITKGDNNDMEDQTFAFAGIGRVYPVKDEWIVGKVLFVVPFIGFVPLYLWKILAVLIIIWLVNQLQFMSNDRDSENGKRDEEK